MSAIASQPSGSAHEHPTSSPGHQHAAIHDKADLTWLPAALGTLYEALPIDPANVVEGLGGASCDPRIKDVALLGIGFAAEGRDADQWRSVVFDRAGAEVAPLLAESERCMRGSGLWPWAK